MNRRSRAPETRGIPGFPTSCLRARSRPSRWSTLVRRPTGRHARDSGERPAGVEPARSPWQGDRLPLHHGRKMVCRIVNEQEHREGLEPSSPHYGCGILAAGRPVPSIASVGPEGLEPSLGGLRARCAAADTLIPCILLTSTQWARRESNPRPGPYKRPALTTELRASEWGRRDSNPCLPD